MISCTDMSEDTETETTVIYSTMDDLETSKPEWPRVTEDKTHSTNSNGIVNPFLISPFLPGHRSRRFVLRTEADRKKYMAMASLERKPFLSALLTLGTSSYE